MAIPKRIVRFGLIGLVNTGLDFGLLFLLTHFGLNAIVANFISTGTAFIFSFIANRSYTFKAAGGNLRHQIVLFFFFTFFGLWVLQPLIILGVERLLVTSHFSSEIVLLIGKLLASAVTLVWNYFFYSRVVFRESPTHADDAIEIL